MIIGGVVAKQAILLYVFLYWNKTKEKKPLHLTSPALLKNQNDRLVGVL